MLSSSFKSDSFRGQNLDSNSFPTNFDHAAAGHDGLRCHLSGALIAKPCTQAEVAFYESSIHHPQIRAFMPHCFGQLVATEQRQPSPLAVEPRNHGKAVLSSLATHSTAKPIAVANQISADHHAISREKPWTPSGGRQLDTGISIVLENIAEGFKRPNVLDVKLGSRLWADDAPPAKRVKLDAVSRETTSGSLGYRIAGMRVWKGYDKENTSLTARIEAEFTDPYMTRYEGSGGPKGEAIEKNGYKCYDKWYGRTMTAQNVKEGFETFLAGAKAGKVDRSGLIASRILQELQALKFALESEESRMYSSSILIIYEGDPEALEEALVSETARKELNQSRSSFESETATEPLDEVAEEFELTELGTLQPIGLASDITGNGNQSQNIDGSLITLNIQNIQIDPASLADMDDDEDSDEEEVPIKVHDFRLIDFAHASWTPGQGPDENTLTGIRNLIKMMEELASEQEASV